jgi:hypothetical protein
LEKEHFRSSGAKNALQGLRKCPSLLIHISLNFNKSKYSKKLVRQKTVLLFPTTFILFLPPPFRSEYTYVSFHILFVFSQPPPSLSLSPCSKLARGRCLPHPSISPFLRHLRRLQKNLLRKLTLSFQLERELCLKCNFKKVLVFFRYVCLQISR